MTSSGLRIYEDAANDIVWFDNSPDAGDPTCICSYRPCQELIEQDEITLRIWGDGSEARFHTRCWNKISPHEFDLHLQETDEYPEDVP